MFGYWMKAVFPINPIINHFSAPINHLVCMAKINIHVYTSTSYRIKAGLG